MTYPDNNNIGYQFSSDPSIYFGEKADGNYLLFLTKHNSYEMEQTFSNKNYLDFNFSVDTTNEIDHCDFNYNDETIQTIYSAPYSFRINFSDLNQDADETSTHNIKITCQDTIGNTYNSHETKLMTFYTDKSCIDTNQRVSITQETNQMEYCCSEDDYIHDERCSPDGEGMSCILTDYSFCRSQSNHDGICQEWENTVTSEDC